MAEKLALATPIPERAGIGRVVKACLNSALRTSREARTLAISYLQSQQPNDYEISDSALILARALTSISMTNIGTDRRPIYEPVYKFPKVDDLVAQIAVRNPDQRDIQTPVNNAVSAVVASYRTAMAMKEFHGVLPIGSPNIEQFIKSLDECTLFADPFIFTPYAGISAGGLSLVLNRSTSAILLAESSRTRAPRSYVDDLARYLAAA